MSCFKVSKTPFVTLVSLGIALTVIVGDGNCDDSNSVASSSGANNGNKVNNNEHGHHNWKGWEDWLPSSSSSSSPQHEHRIPLAPKKVSSRRMELPSKKSPKGKKSFPEGNGSSLQDLKSIKETAINLATTVANHFASQWSSSPDYNAFFPPPPPPHQQSRNGRTVYLENLANRQDGPNEGLPEREAKRGVIDWLARLIGVQGKTLGEFLREYQVHVLYDLAFTFFKWIFFLYAGLLIP